MIKLFNFPIQIQQNQALKHNTINKSEVYNYRKIKNLSNMVHDSYNKILFLQINAMAEQDNKTCVGKILNIFV